MAASTYYGARRSRCLTRGRCNQLQSRRPIGNCLSARTSHATVRKRLAMAAFGESCRRRGHAGSSEPVKGFGCQPLANGAAVCGGRRPKAREETAIWDRWGCWPTEVGGAWPANGDLERRAARVSTRPSFPHRGHRCAPDPGRAREIWRAGKAIRPMLRRDLRAIPRRRGPY